MSELAIRGGTPVRTTPFPAWPVFDEREVEAVSAVVRSGKWWRGAFSAEELGSDPGADRSQVEMLEEAFATHHRARHAIAVSNGNAALEISLRALGVGAGDEVVTTPYTFISTSVCILNNNAIPVYVDVEPDTLNMNADLLEAAVTERTRAIIPVHFGGEICDMDKINAVAAKHDLKVIEDACHAHGTALDDGRMPGSFGDTAAFSFQASKNMTSGEGGMLLVGDDALADMCYSLHHVGRRRGGLWYEHFNLGWNYRITEFQAAVLLVQLSRLDEQNTTRMENARCLSDELAKMEGITPRVLRSDQCRHSHHVFALRYDARQFGGVPRERFVEALGAEGIPAMAGYAFPSYGNPLMRDKAFGKRLADVDVDYAGYAKKCPVAERLCAEESVWLEHRLLLGTRADTDDIVTASAKVKTHCAQLA